MGELGIGERAPRDEVGHLALAREEHVADGAHALVAGGVGEQVAAGRDRPRRRPTARWCGCARRRSRPAARPPRRAPRGRGPRRWAAGPRRRGSRAPRHSRLALLGAVHDLPRPRPSPARCRRRDAGRRPPRRSLRSGPRPARARRAAGCPGPSAARSCDAEATEACAISIAIGPPPIITMLSGARSSSKTVSLVM